MSQKKEKETMENRGLAVIKGAGDLASGIALRLHRCGYQIIMTEITVPTTVRRTVAFSPAVYLGETQVEDVTGVRCHSLEEIKAAVSCGRIAVIVDEKAEIVKQMKPQIVVDAILAKYNTGTSITDAPTVIAIGPGFCAGTDCHCVVESKRGHYLGRCIWDGPAIANTGVPGLIGGYGLERLIRASDDGVFRGTVSIGDQVKAGELVGYAGETPIYAQIDGVVRGLLQDGVLVTKGMKSGDVDPRCERKHCFTVSDKASSIGGGVLEAILCHQTANPRTALVVLAAGDSRRFESNKLLVPVDGMPMYRHILEETAGLSKTVFRRKILVSQYEEILQSGTAYGFTTVENRDSSLGVSHSIHLALEALEQELEQGGLDGICFAVCDQPWLTKKTISGLVNGWKAGKTGLGTVSCRGRDGSPAVFSVDYVPELKGLLGDQGGRAILSAHPQEVYRYETGDPRELEDVDTREDMAPGSR